MILEGKRAVIFAASGAIASGVARAYARHGATVYVSAKRPVDDLVDELRELGASAFGAVVDATDETAVRNYLTAIAKEGRIDTVFNGIGGRPQTLGYPARSLETSLDAFDLPFSQIVRSQFLTSREAIRCMENGGSVVLLSATLSAMAASQMANLSSACGAIEALGRSLAGEFGPNGVRVNCVRGSAMPETRTIQETGAGQAALNDTPPTFGVPPLGRPISVEDTARAAVFLASDLASGVTAQTLTVCAGQFPS
ncbi:MAG: SDR family oxidoreductase [Myxococcota bacterium]